MTQYYMSSDGWRDYDTPWGFSDMGNLIGLAVLLIVFWGLLAIVHGGLILSGEKGVISGILLWKRKEFGYVTGLGLLFQGSMLFIALIIFLLLQPLLTDAPFVIADVIVIAVMGLVCFIPFGMFVRGVVKVQDVG